MFVLGLLIFINVSYAYCVDYDGDGYGAGDGCLGYDCDDGNPLVWYLQGFYLDEDHDGYGTGEIVRVECWGESGYFDYPLDELAFNNLDCNDLDPVIHPYANEICENDIDENCDGFDIRCSIYPELNFYGWWII